MQTLETFLTNPHYTFFIKILISLSVLIGFVIFKRLVRRLILKLFSSKKYKFTELFDDLSQAIERPFDTLWMTTGVYFAFLASPFIHRVSTPQPELYISESLSLSLDLIPLAWINNGYSAIIIGLIAWAAHNLVAIYEKLLIGIGSRFTLFDNALIIRFTAKLIKGIVIITASLMIINIFLPLTTFVASVGILGAAFTFIAKDTLTDILNGIVLMIDKPFTIGDWIQISSIEGIVEDVSFRSTRIRTFEQGVVVIPNTTLSNDNILNWSRMGKRRYRFSFGVTYDTPPAELHAFIEEIKVLLNTYEDIEKDSFLVYFDNFGNFSLNIIIQYYTFKTDIKGFSSLKENINMHLLSLANERGINVAFPSQTIYVENNN